MERDQGGIVRGDRTRKEISLVFTGGDHADGVAAILHACRSQGVPASFFLTGAFLAKHPEAVRAIVRDGHLVGPHSDQHLLYAPWSDRSKSIVSEAQFKADLRKNVEDLDSLGAKRSPYFLPPFEWFNADQVRWSQDLGLTLINFTPGSGSNRDYIPESDPKFQSSQAIVDGILSFESRSPDGMNGFLLLLHAGSLRQDKVHDRLESLLIELKRRGYRFVTLDDLLTVRR